MHHVQGRSPSSFAAAVWNAAGHQTQHADAPKTRELVVSPRLRSSLGTGPEDRLPFLLSHLLPHFEDSVDKVFVKGVTDRDDLVDLGLDVIRRSCPILFQPAELPTGGLRGLVGALPAAFNAFFIAMFAAGVESILGYLPNN